METVEQSQQIRVVGKQKLSTIERFGKNQRRAILVAPPKKVSAKIERRESWASNN